VGKIFKNNKRVSWFIKEMRVFELVSVDESDIIGTIKMPIGTNVETYRNKRKKVQCSSRNKVNLTVP
jgi:hypothetical protein